MMCGKGCDGIVIVFAFVQKELFCGQRKECEQKETIKLYLVDYHFRLSSVREQQETASDRKVCHV